jgi:hypothetical protein
MTKKSDHLERSKISMQKAREIGVDEHSSGADPLMGRLSRTPPQHEPKPRVGAAKLRDIK